MKVKWLTLWGIPTVTDRIIQQVIFQVISPIFEKQFNDNLSAGVMEKE